MNKHCGHPLPDALRGFQRTSGFDFPKACQHERCVNLADRDGSQRRKYLTLQAVQDIIGVNGRPSCLVQLVPSPSNRLKSCRVVSCRHELALKFLDRGISQIAKLTARRISPLPGV
jgi:hypothetical protein